MNGGRRRSDRAARGSIADHRSFAATTGLALFGQTTQQPDQLDMRLVAAVGELIRVDLGEPGQHSDARATRRLCRRGAALEENSVQLAIAEKVVEFGSNPKPPSAHNDVKGLAGMVLNRRDYDNPSRRSTLGLSGVSS
jgi:hypothetical protein